jgi:hypothetical protein
MEMFKHALAVLVISAASATSVAAHADWNGAARYAPPRHVVVAPRYCPPVHPAPSSYRYWAPAPHYYAPYRYAPYAYAPSNHGWRNAWRRDRFDDHGHGWNNHGWNNHDWNRGSDHGSWNGHRDNH